MQRITFLLAGTLLVLGACQMQRPSKTKEKYTLVWADEFDYTGLPDPARWAYDVGGHGWGNNELQYYTQSDTSNAVVRDGRLFLTARKATVEGKQFSSARLVTRGLAEWTYGKIEIHAKLPKGRGLWPAAWMLGANIDKVGWPKAGEIDIMEHVGFNPDSIFGTVHTEAYNHMKNTQKGKTILINDPYTKFHTFAVDWSADKMDFLLDHQVYYTIYNEKTGTDAWPFDNPFYLLLNLAVGGNLGGVKGVDETVFPAVMEVDYVRVYQVKPR
jgi:beta-glucanase (GH16 family)